MRNLISVILLCITVAASAKNIRIDSRKDLQQQFKQDKATYIVNTKIDLGCQTLYLPLSSTLKFEDSGYLVNGTIEGNISTIEADARPIFDTSIVITGTWNNRKVYSTWFTYEEGTSSNEQWRNITCFCEGKKTTHLYSPDTTYLVSAINQSAPIELPSNVYWHNQSTFQMQGCNFTKYSIVLIRNVENITIDGGTFLGDISTHIGNEGEWGHGIKVGGGKNIKLKNLSCNYCWGDGIDLIEGFDSGGDPTVNSIHITIDNVRCLYNRRQGMSIEAADHVNIKNSEFAFTGAVKRTDPSAGIDIEPWIDNAEKIYDIQIKNCKLHDNKGHDFHCMANWQMKDRFHTFPNDIVLEDCEIGSTWVTKTVGISFIKCNLKKNTAFYKANKVTMERSFIQELKKNDVDNFKKRKCKLPQADISYIVAPAVGVITLSLLAIAYRNNRNKDEINRNHNNS